MPISRQELANTAYNARMNLSIITASTIISDIKTRAEQGYREHSASIPFNTDENTIIAKIREEYPDIYISSDHNHYVINIRWSS